MTSLWFNPYMYKITERRYPPLALTSSANTITGQPYGNFTYTVTQSSSLASPTYDAYHVFDYSVGTDNTFWAAAGYNNSTGIYSGGASRGGVSGAWMQLQISTPITINSYRIASRNDVYWKNGLLDSWTLLGTNNQTSGPWTTLDTRSGLVLGNWAQNTFNTYTIASPAAFLFYVIVVQRVIPESVNLSDYCNIGELQLLGL